MKKISLDCPHCQIFQTIVIADNRDTLDFACGGCQKNIPLQHLNQQFLKICPVCQDTQFYQHKDFNKALGLIIFIVGAVLVPWTYAISLIAALLIDAILYPFFPWMEVCYNCRSDLRGWPKNPEHDRFNHETAAHYEYGKKRTWPSTPN